jgi:hypothetical protein
MSNSIKKNVGAKVYDFTMVFFSFAPDLNVTSYICSQDANNLRVDLNSLDLSYKNVDILLSLAGQVTGYTSDFIG